jgi:ABC-type amino acid transport substrate-binding protein
VRFARSAVTRPWFSGNNARMTRHARLAVLAIPLLALPILAATAVFAGDEPTAPRIDPAKLRANIAALSADTFNGRSFRSEEGKAAARWVAEKLADAGATPLPERDSMLVPVARMPAAAPNVVAWHAPKGPTPSGEYILVTAHFDHLPPASSGEDRIYNGADDNASGTCGMIAVAEALRDAKLDVGVVFVGFTGEESGLIGSRAFLEEETLPPARIRGMFNMDMISRQPDGAIRLDGGPKGKVLVDLLMRLAPTVPIEMKVDTHPDWLARSDQGPFLSAGIPAVLFSCEDHEDYHKVTDHADKADAELAARVSSLVALAVTTYAREMQPRFDMSPVFADDGTQRRPIRVGRTMPNAPYWTASTRRSPDRGADAALVEALASGTGWRFEEKSVAIGGEREALRSGEIDLAINGCAPGAGDAATIVAIEPPYLAGGGVALLVLNDSKLVDASALTGLRIAARPGTAAWNEIAMRCRDTPPLAMTGPEGLTVQKLESGELDAIAGDRFALEVRTKRDPKFRTVAVVGHRTHVLARTADTELVRRMAETLRALEVGGGLAGIRARFATDPASVPEKSK